MMKRTVAMVVLMVASFMDLMDAMITNVALPAIRDDLGASSAQLEWTTSAYVLMFAVLLITGGRIGDLVGRRTVFLAGVAGFTLASLGAAMAPGGGLLVIARGIQGGNSDHWSARIIGILVLGVLAAIGFVILELGRERRQLAVLLPMHLFRTRGFAVGSAVQITNYLGWGSFAIMISIYTQEALHFTAMQAGLTMLPVTLGSFAGTAFAPLAAKLGRAAVVIGGGLQAIGFAGYALAIHLAGDGLSIWALAAPLFVTGVGMIIFAVPLMTDALHRVPTHDAGAASGAFSMFQQLGSVFGVAIVGIAFFGIIGSGASQPTYQHAIIAGNWITIASFAVTGVLALLLPKPRKENAPDLAAEKVHQAA